MKEQERLEQVKNKLLMVKEELCFGGDWETARKKIDEIINILHTLYQEQPKEGEKKPIKIDCFKCNDKFYCEVPMSASREKCPYIKIESPSQPLDTSPSVSTGEGLLLTEEEIDKLIGSMTSERYLARHCTHQEAQILIKAQLLKVQQYYDALLAADKSTGDALDKAKQLEISKLQARIEELEREINSLIHDTD